MSNRLRLIGHRGAPCHAPEHTRASYRAAFAAGVEFVEPDVVPTRDGVLVVMHGPRLDATTDIAERPEFAHRIARKRFGRIAETGWFAEDFDWAEIATLRCRERWPELRPVSAALNDTEGPMRLRELVDLTAAEAPATSLVVELKHDDRTSRLGFSFVGLLRTELEGRWESSVLANLHWESFELPPLRALAEAGLPGRRIVLVEDPAFRMEGEEGPERLTDAGLAELVGWAHGVSVRTTILTRDVVEAAHRHGLEVFAYTLRPEDAFLPEHRHGDPESHWCQLLATGVDAVFCDDPARVRAMLVADATMTATA